MRTYDDHFMAKICLESKMMMISKKESIFAHARRMAAFLGFWRFEPMSSDLLSYVGCIMELSISKVTSVGW